MDPGTTHLLFTQILQPSKIRSSNKVCAFNLTLGILNSEQTCKLTNYTFTGNFFNVAILPAILLDR